MTTEKRYYLHKHLIRNDEIHDKICHRWLKGKDLEEDMNTLYSKYSYLKKENEQLKSINKYLIELLEHNGATVEIEKIER